MKKIAVIGCGFVGSTYILDLLQQGVQADYLLVDKNTNLADGHVRDLRDSKSLKSHNGSTFNVGTYDDLKDADVVAITASIPTVPTADGEVFTDRLQLMTANVKILNEIALELKRVGFKGLSIIPTNPCDVMAGVYQKVTGFDPHKIISTGCQLETMRTRKMISEALGVNSDSVEGFVVGEHGSGAIVPWSVFRVGNVPMKQLIAEGKIKEEYVKDIFPRVVKEAFEIIKFKKATYFGIAESMSLITRAYIYNLNMVLGVGVQLDDKYVASGIYFTVPAVVGKHGWKLHSKLQLSQEEQAAFDKSALNIQKVTKDALDLIGFKN
ncbi:L-lactate dehydrogenase [Mycoplasmoides gallisepticum str. F]|uniref:Lactate dehydrogenase n=1 Tax=Mycoplasmoides gallisepticum S6 TaxID=1006581 RepID=A0A0F6CJX6_MYCGL|nr:L-lactate dehydrogenase [Mycoplasmoides gallisepticum]AAB95409.1 lactate dehydrogenase [Mycoplasmoides gallisepticum]ADC31021.1 L-lactate dehydrogenase [Mycoplasmoides gallisepticum str. F]AHB99398.1 lactate dehydrogenase [Mycoplasmoides gallisepticum S6]QEX45623.1 L-lactate dehydrogenase [Mycoplasmoides gallisepticum]WVH36725.1 L-lactate dehydrogenase [Mycoplasmoides gallisepticum]